MAALLALCFLTLPANAEAAGKKVPVTVNKNAVVTIKSTKKIKWKSSKKKVLTLKKVSKKKVRLIAKKKGTAKVTITVGKKKYTCKVTVKSISGKKANVVVTVGGKKYTCKATAQQSSTAVTPVPAVTPSPTPTPAPSDNDPTSENTDQTGGNTVRADYLNADGTLKDGYSYVCGDKRQVAIEEYLGDIIGWVKVEDVDLNKYRLEPIQCSEAYYLPVDRYRGISSFTGYVDGKPNHIRVYDEYGNQVNDFNIFMDNATVFGYFENLDGVTLSDNYCIGFPEFPHFRDVTVELINNKDEDGNLIFVPSYNRKNLNENGGLLLNSTQCASVVFSALRAGEADAIITNGNKSITVHLVSEPDSKDTEFTKYHEWIRAMVTTEVGTEKTINVDGEEIHVDGVKGADDVETLVNLGAWVASHKIHDGGTVDYGYDTYFSIFRDVFLGADCGGLNEIIVSGATILGHAAWQYLDSRQHVPMAVIIDDWLWDIDVGGSGTTLPRSVTANGLAPNGLVKRSYIFNPPETDIWNHDKWGRWDWYFDKNSSGVWVRRQ